MRFIGVKHLEWDDGVEDIGTVWRDDLGVVAEVRSITIFTSSQRVLKIRPELELLKFSLNTLEVDDEVNAVLGVTILITIFN